MTAWGGKGPAAVVDFTAEHCAPCRMLAPSIDALARDLAGRVTVAKVDADGEPALTARFGIRGTPTVLFFRDGELIDRIVGAVPEARLRAKVQELRTNPVSGVLPGGRRSRSS